MIKKEPKLAKNDAHEKALEVRREAFNLLARRDYTSHALQKKLLSKGYPIEKITDLIEELVAGKLIDNQRHLENVIASQKNKGYGPKRIAQHLSQQGYSREEINAQLFAEENDWLTNIKSVWLKKFKGKKPTNFKEKAQQSRHLQYKGFSQEHIESFLKFEEDI